MASRASALAQANPASIANAAYINALFREKYGRNATQKELQRFSGRTVGDASNLVLGKASAFGDYRRPTNTDPVLTPEDQAASDLQGLIDKLTPKPVGDDELSSRFSALFDPTYAQNETDIEQDVTQRRSRFAEDTGVSEARRARARAEQQRFVEEQQAAGGASGQLADEQRQRTLRPFDNDAQDSSMMSSRFSTDIDEERKRRLRANRQSKATSRAAYLADPNNRYEFSY